MTRLIPLMLLLTLVALTIGCSASDRGAVIPPADGTAIERTPDMHQFWGLWQFKADPAAQTLEIIPIRAGDFHLNALQFLEPPPLVNLTLESLQFNGKTINADISLRNPFLGFNKFTGFDVCGVLITNGSITGFDDPDLRMAGKGDTRLLNPDGYTRWWNPAEFPNDNTMLSYKDGLLGTPDSSAHYNSTLNAYKYFCDDLDADESLTGITLEKRGMFSAGQKNIRHYTIELGSEGLIFNYAVDANWQFPTGPKPWQIPDDFGPGANRVEAYRISAAEVSNTLWNDGTSNGGDLSLSIDVYDWFNASANKVKVESTGNFPPVTTISPSAGGDGFSTYAVDVIGATPAQGSIDLLVTIESEAVGYQDLLPGKTVSAYFTVNVAVGTTPPVTGELIALADADKYEIAPNTTVYFNGTRSYDENGFAIVDYTWDFGDSSPTAKGEFVNHLYTTAGLYSIKLTVENEEGTTDDDNIGILVCDCAGKNDRHLSATWNTGDLDSSEENYDKRATDHMYNDNYWIMQNGDDIVGFDMDQAPGGYYPPQLNPVVTLDTGVTGVVYSLDCGSDDRVAWASDSDKTVIHIISSTGVQIKDLSAPSGEEFWAADFDIGDDLWVVTQDAGGTYWAHQYNKGDDNSYKLVDIWTHKLPDIAAAKHVFDIQVLHSTESMYITSDCVNGIYTPAWPGVRIDVYDRFGDYIRNRVPYSYWSVYPDPWPHADIELDSTNPALEACRLNWYMTYQQPAGYFCNAYRRLTLLLEDISVNFDQCDTRYQAMDLSNTTKRLESIDLDSDQYRYWVDIPADW